FGPLPTYTRIASLHDALTIFTKWGSFGTADGQFSAPQGVAVDGSGNVFVGDQNNNRVQKFTNTGTFLLTFGWGVQDGMAAFETCTWSCKAGDSGHAGCKVSVP